MKHILAVNYIAITSILTLTLSVMVALNAPKPAVEDFFSRLCLVLSVMVPLIGLWAFGWPGILERLQQKVQSQKAKTIFLLCLIPTLSYGIYLPLLEKPLLPALGLGVAFLILPGMLLVAFPPNTPKMTWVDFIAILCFFVPFDQRYPDLIWPTPGGMSYVYASLIAACQVIITFGVIRPQLSLGFRFIPQRSDIRIGMIAYGTCILVVAPIGLSTGFLKWNPDNLQLASVITSFLGIWLSIAAIEELVFRGVLQNLLTQRISSVWIAIGISSILFGWSHWNNAKGLDWNYLFLATVAGGFYGWAFWKSKGLFAPMLAHTLIDTTWKHLLHA